MKLQIKFFAKLYKFLIKDYTWQLNEKNKIKLPYFLFKKLEEVNFILQNIHILDLPYCKPKSIQAIKVILQLYLQKLNELKINIPKFEHHIRNDIFLEQNIVEKILQPPIKELDTSYILFKEYDLRELKALIYENLNRPVFNSSFNEFVQLLNFINQFFCVSNTKINYCAFHFVNELSDRGFDPEYLKTFLNNEIDIELNYTDEVSVYDGNLDHFINSSQVSYNRFLVLYHELFNKFDSKNLNILFNACNNNNKLLKLLISKASSASSHNLEKTITKVINKSINTSEVFIHFIISYREEFLNSYYDLFEKLSIKHSNLLINACSNDNELLKLLIAPLNSLNLSLDERYNILEAVIKKCENKPQLIPLLSTQLLNILAYYNTKYSFKTGILSIVSFWLESLTENYTITTNWYYSDGTSFEASKYCKLLGEDLYT